MIWWILGWGGCIFIGERSQLLDCDESGTVFPLSDAVRIVIEDHCGQDPCDGGGDGYVLASATVPGSYTIDSLGPHFFTVNGCVDEGEDLNCDAFLQYTVQLEAGEVIRLDVWDEEASDDFDASCETAVLEFTVVPDVCEDVFTPSHDDQNAVSLQVEQAPLLLEMVQEADEDWYFVDLYGDNRCEFFSDPDMNFRALDLDLEPILHGVTSVSATVHPVVPTTFFLVAERNEHPVCTPYTLSMTCETCGARDPNEPDNDEASLAVPLGASSLLTELGWDDQDWYSVHAAAGQVVTATVSNGNEPVEIEIYDGGELIDSSHRPPHEVVLVAPRSGEFLVRVASDTCQFYELDLTVE